MKQCLKLIREGNLKDAEEMIKQGIVIDAALEHHFTWINHPEYLRVGDIEERDGILQAIVTYRGEHEATVHLSCP